MKYVLTILLVLLALSVAFAQDKADITFAWDLPTTNVDGSPLTDLAGFYLYEGVYVKDAGGIERCDPPWTVIADIGPTVTQTMVTFLEKKGAYCVAGASYDTSGNVGPVGDSMPIFTVKVLPNGMYNLRILK